MKSVKNFFNNTLRSTMVIIIAASMMVVASVAASQTIFTELFIGDDGSYCTMTYDGTGSGNNYNLPDNFLNGGRWSDNFSFIAERLSQYHGVSVDTASDNLHAIKNHYNLPGSYNCIFDYTGGVYNQNGDYIGSLITGL